MKNARGNDADGCPRGAADQFPGGKFSQQLTPGGVFPKYYFLPSI